ncbi:hypothetical protein Trydic_g3417 [Trypoxylus dichotomus]
MEQKVRITNGNVRNEKNIFGINCMDTEEEVKGITNQLDDSTDRLKDQSKEYYGILSTVERIMQQLLLQQENRSLLIANQQSKSDTYWKNLTEDYKDLFQTMQQSISDTLLNITHFFTTSESTSTTNSDELRSLLEQWKLIQDNFTDALKADRNNFLESIQSSLEALVSKIQCNFKEIRQYFVEANAFRNSSYKTNVSFPRSASFNANEKITPENGTSKALLVAVYGIFVVLIVGLVLALLSKFKSCREIKAKHEECSSLNSMPV